MAFRKVDLIQSNFAAGEIDPEMRHRSDVGAYGAGVETLINFMPRLHGGLRTKPGTIFKAELPGDAVLFPFIFSETQAYILAFSNLRLDVYFDNGNIAEANITTPYTTAQIPNIRVAQAADVALICHNEVTIKRLTRVGASDFTLSDYGFDFDDAGNIKKCPFYNFNAGVKINPNSTSGSLTITADADVWVAGHVGSVIRHKGKQALITAFSNARSITVTAKENFTDSDETQDWDEEAFTSINGFPRAVCFHDQRLVFAGTTKKKSGIWLSQVGKFFNFDVGEGEDDEASWSGIDDDRVQEVRHVISHGHLQIFCDDTEAFVPETATAPITPGNFSIRSQTRYGILEEVAPAILDEGTIYAQRYGAGIREYLFTDLTQRYDSNLVSVLDARIVNDPKSIAVVASSADRPELYTYIVMGDGSIAVLHSLRAEKVVAWSRWNTPNGNYKSVASVLGNLFVAVQRTINSQSKFYLELMSYDTVLESAKQVAKRNTDACTITITDQANIAVGTKVTLKTADGNTVVFTSEAAGGGAPSATNGWRPNTDNNTTADNLRAAINSNSNFTAADPSANTITVTRDVKGPNNLDVITTDSTRVAVTNFTDGNKAYTGMEHLAGETVNAVQNNILPLGTGTVSTSAVTAGLVELTEEGTSGGANPFIGLYQTATLTTLPVEFPTAAGRTTLRRKRIAQAVIGVKDGVVIRAGNANQLQLYDVNSDFSLEPSQKTTRLRVFPRGFQDDVTLTVNATVPVPITILSLAYRLAF